MMSVWPLVVGLLALALLPVAAPAQEPYPARPVTIVVPFPPRATRPRPWCRRSARPSGRP